VSSAFVPGLSDTTVLADLVRGHPPATYFLLAINKLGGLQFSRATAIEMLRECQSDAERLLALPFISTSLILDLTDAIARRAVDLLTQIPLPTALTTSDAIVAATAIEHSIPLYTLDPARFAAIPTLATIQPC
jgi:predicted nucleic acid-binding protein